MLNVKLNELTWDEPKLFTPDCYVTKWLSVLTVGQQGSDTVFLVVVLVSTVGAVFFVFAFMALCYRSVVVHNQCCYIRDRLDNVIFIPKKPPLCQQLFIKPISYYNSPPTSTRHLFSLRYIKYFPICVDLFHLHIYLI